MAIRGVVVALVAFVLVFAVVVGKLAAARVEYLPPSLTRGVVSCDYGAGARLGPVVDDIRMDWYSSDWRAAGEGSLYLASLRPVAKRGATYRFTWLRSFHPPVIVRVDIGEDGAARLVAKQLSGAGGYEPGGIARQMTRTLTSQEAAEFRAALAATRVLTLPPTDCRLGADGAQWIFEANDHGRYVFVDRWTPASGPVRDIGLTFLRLTGWRVDPVY